MWIVLITVAREQPHGQIDRQQFVHRELHIVQRPTVVEDITPPLFDESCPHGLKKGQIATDGAWIDAKLMCELTSRPSLEVLNQFTFNLPYAFQTIFWCSHA